MKITDAELIEMLESIGIPWYQHFVIGTGLVGYRDENGRLFARVIEDNELNLSVCKFLIKSGKVQKVGQP